VDIFIFVYANQIDFHHAGSMSTNIGRIGFNFEGRVSRVSRLPRLDLAVATCQSCPMLRVDPAVLKARLRDTEQFLETEGLGALVVFAQGSAVGWASRMHGHLRYLCNWDSHHYPSALILVPGAVPVLFTPNKFLEIMAREITDIGQVLFAPLPEFGHRIADVLKAANRGTGRIGLVGLSEMPVPVWDGLRQGLSAVDWVDVTAHLNARRAVKDSLQVAFHRRGAEICDLLCQALTREIPSGRTAYQIRAELQRIGFHEGCEFCETWLTAQPRADCARLYRDLCQRVPETGDQVILGIYLMVDGHWGHAIRTGNVGPANDEHGRLLDVVLEMQESALARLRPGTDLNDVEAAFESVFHRHFPEGDSGGIFRFCNAHGLGLSYDEPDVGAAFPQPYGAGGERPGPIEARPGMVFEFHPNIFVAGLGAAAIGDMVLVTEDGHEILTRFPRHMNVW
jgi:Xaa-Pro dipeptidase